MAELDLSVVQITLKVYWFCQTQRTDFLEDMYDGEEITKFLSQGFNLSLVLNFDG